MARAIGVLWAAIIVVMISRSGRADDVPAAGAAKPEALVVGSAMPGFESLDDFGQAWKSAEHLGKKVLVLYFYPGDFTGGCTRQAQAYRDTLAKIEELGAEVVGVSGDQSSTHQLFKETHGLKHSLLADTEGKLATVLGVPVGPTGKVRATGPDRKPLLDAEGKRVDIERPVTLGRWTVVVGVDGRVVSVRKVGNPVTDAEEVHKIVASLQEAK